MQGSSNDLHAAAAATEPLGRIADLLAHLRIRTRIGALMLLAALVAALLAAMGIRGLAASKESLRVVYEDRMEPVRSLSQISHLMLANQLQMQLALARANPQGAWQIIHTELCSQLFGFHVRHLGLLSLRYFTS